MINMKHIPLSDEAEKSQMRYSDHFPLNLLKRNDSHLNHIHKYWCIFILGSVTRTHPESAAHVRHGLPRQRYREHWLCFFLFLFFLLVLEQCVCIYPSAYTVAQIWLAESHSRTTLIKANGQIIYLKCFLYWSKIMV